MSTIDPTATLGDLVLDEPGRAEIFDRLGLDYCCRGGRTLAEACAQQDLDANTVAAVLAALGSGAAEHDFDARGASTDALCDHIVEAHHDHLRSELPRLTDTLQTVVRVHAGDEPSLNDVARVFAGLRAELEEHMELEESRLFPACRAVEAGELPSDDALLGELEHEHAAVGEALVVLRDLTGGFRTDEARCSTHRALLDGLRALELDLHRHIHEENNLLFPRIRAAASRPERSPA
jgi:regulator of cell morphogenesis and NO signaling